LNVINITKGPNREGGRPVKKLILPTTTNAFFEKESELINTSLDTEGTETKSNLLLKWQS
jgi:hypothetical protein